MQFFTAIPEGQAIIHGKGVYRQVPVFERDGKIYAKHGGGFVRLLQGGGTTSPSVRWADIDTPQGEWVERAQYVFYTAKPETQKPEAQKDGAA